LHRVVVQLLRFGFDVGGDFGFASGSQVLRVAEVGQRLQGGGAFWLGCCFGSRGAFWLGLEVVGDILVNGESFKAKSAFNAGGTRA
jgi:hypothetical protein